MVAVFCHAYCVERAASGGLGVVHGLSTGEKMHVASIGAASLAATAKSASIVPAGEGTAMGNTACQHPLKQ